MEATSHRTALGASRIVQPRGRATALRLRAAEPRDIERVGQFLRGLAPAARYGRCHAGVAGVSDRVVGRLLKAKAPGRRALLLERGRGDRQIIGLAQLAQESDTTAEIALVVAADWQRLGLGRVLLEELSRLASPDYQRLSAYVQPDNQPLLALLRGASDSLVAEHQGPVVRLTWPAREAAGRRDAAA